MMAEDPRLTIASFNPGKLVEYRTLLDGLRLTLSSLNDYSNIVEIEETGTTFTDNARLKAAGYARQTGTVVLADDSGLEIDALGGRPGVQSARYGGEIGFA
jgi:XTP/dITP diphosphohydrolase